MNNAYELHVMYFLLSLLFVHYLQLATCNTANIVQQPTTTPCTNFVIAIPSFPSSVSSSGCTTNMLRIFNLLPFGRSWTQLGALDSLLLLLLLTKSPCSQSTGFSNSFRNKYKALPPRSALTKPLDCHPWPGVRAISDVFLASSCARRTIIFCLSYSCRAGSVARSVHTRLCSKRAGAALEALRGSGTNGDTKQRSVWCEVTRTNDDMMVASR